MDFNARGNFKIVEIGNVIASNVMMIQNEIQQKIQSGYFASFQTVNISRASMDFTYELKTKDPDAISKMFFLNDIT